MTREATPADVIEGRARWCVVEGDCLDVLGSLPDGCVDAVVTDPPYGLSFMGRDWDHGVPGEAFWSAAMQTAKPGAHLLAFGGTRTFHRLTCAIEDAGWEIRDCLSWLYGTGFPKSLDVSKALDKLAGAEREVVGVQPDRWTQKGGTYNFSTDRPQDVVPVTGAPATEAARQWAGWGTALKPAWEPVILARAPLSESSVARNVLAHGCGGINVDGCRIETPGGSPAQQRRRQAAVAGWAPPRAGIDVRCASRREGARASVETYTTERAGEAIGRYPANLVLDESAAALLDVQSGYSKSPGTDSVARLKRQASEHTVSLPPMTLPNGHGDSGGASRFFYTSKASRRDRGKGNNHPTVKPTDLMRWLVRLVTPPGGLVLDPFAGSGTTGVAALAEGARVILIEREAEYCEIARNRCEAEAAQGLLFGGVP